MITFRPFYPIPVLENNDNGMENDIISIIMSIISMRKRSKRCDKDKESFSYGKCFKFAPLFACLFPSLCHFFSLTVC